MLKFVYNINNCLVCKLVKIKCTYVLSVAAKKIDRNWCQAFTVTITDDITNLDVIQIDTRTGRKTSDPTFELTNEKGGKVQKLSTLSLPEIVIEVRQ